MSTHRGMKLGPYLWPYTKISSKYIKDFNRRLETMKMTEGKKSENRLQNSAQVGWRDGAVVKSTGCSSRRNGFSVKLAHNHL